MNDNKLYWPIDRLQNWDKNPRSIKGPDFERLKRQITELGQYKPLIITPEGVVLGGNMRLRAYKDLGIAEVWVSIVAPKDEAEKVKIALSDNDQVGQYVEADLAELISALEVPDIEFGDYHVNLSDSLSIDDLLDKFRPTDTKEDDFDVENNLPEVPTSKLGEVYRLGNHRLMCGDSTKIEDLEKLMRGEKADMVFTDPPYNFEGQGAGFLRSNTANMRERVKDMIDFEPGEIAYIKSLDTHTFMFFCNKALIPAYLDIFKDLDFNILVWHKTNPSPFTSNTFLPDIEYLLSFTRKGRVWNNSLKPTSIYSKVYISSQLEGRDNAGDLHPTMKPTKLLQDKIRLCSKPKGIILDIFGGSGSTLIACEKINRVCYMMELDPRYVDVIIARWEKLTGDKANIVSE